MMGIVSSQQDMGDRWSIPPDDTPVPMVQGLKVLVLGATPRRRDKLVQVLRRAKVQAMSAPADIDGYRWAERFVPDVIVAEMCRPGEPGWELRKRLQRHLLLRWVPTLLLRWWNEGDGTEVVSEKTVFECIGEALAPIRMLEERVAAGRTQGERLETWGPEALVRVLCEAGLSGVLTVEDGWNTFEMRIAQGYITAVRRTGSNGKEDYGKTAFFQLLATGQGQWSFVRQAAHGDGETRYAYKEWIGEAHRWCALLFGPDAAFASEERRRCVVVDPAACHDVAALCDDNLEKGVLEAMAAGVSQAEITALVHPERDRVPVENALYAAVQKGALYLHDAPVTPRDPGAIKARATVITLLRMVAADHRGASVNVDGTGTGAQTGYYHFDDGPRESVHVRDAVTVPAVPPEAGETATPYVPPPTASPDEAGSDTAEVAWRRSFDDLGTERPSGFSGLSSHPPVNGASWWHLGWQKWVAIGIAVAMTASLGAFLWWMVQTVNDREPQRPRPQVESTR